MFDKFFNRYLETLLQSSYDDFDEPLDAKYSTEDIHLTAITQLKTEAIGFFYRHGVNTVLRAEGDYEFEQLAHDFALTRNDHDAGFWDRKELEASGLGDELTAICENLGPVDLYVGDDGKLYI